MLLAIRSIKPLHRTEHTNFENYYRNTVYHLDQKKREGLITQADYDVFMHRLETQRREYYSKVRIREQWNITKQE